MSSYLETHSDTSRVFLDGGGEHQTRPGFDCRMSQSSGCAVLTPARATGGQNTPKTPLGRSPCTRALLQERIFRTDGAPPDKGAPVFGPTS